MNGHINQLPDEILRNIFDRTAPSDVERIKMLNKRFNAIGKRYKLGQVEVKSATFRLCTKRMGDGQAKHHIACIADFPEETHDDKKWKFDILDNPAEPNMALLDCIEKCFLKISAIKFLTVDGRITFDMELINTLENTGLDLSKIEEFKLLKATIKLTADELKTFCRKMPLKSLKFIEIISEEALLDDELVNCATERFEYTPTHETECPGLTMDFINAQKELAEPLKEFNVYRCKPGFELEAVQVIAARARVLQKGLDWNFGSMHYSNENDAVLLEFNRQRFPLQISDEGTVARKYEFSQSNRDNFQNNGKSQFIFVMLPAKNVEEEDKENEDVQVVAENGEKGEEQQQPAEGQDQAMEE